MDLTCPRGHTWSLSESEREANSLIVSCPVCHSHTSIDRLADTAQFPEDLGGRPESAQDSFPEVPGFEFVEILGEGGMGIVYKCEETELGRPVALKMLATNRLASAETLRRFHKEAESVAKLQHPNVAQLYRYGEANQRPYLALEFVDGGTLSSLINGQPQAPNEAVKIVETLASAVQHCHQHGVLHRDLKPDNVLLSESGPKITDFGLAKFMDEDAGPTLSGQIMGTPSYMAPEQASGVTKRFGPPVDVYALGAILYELLTGRAPFRGVDTIQTIQMVLVEDPIPPRRLQPDVPRDLDTICLKCLEKQPEKRYTSAAELADDLGRFREGRPIVARPVGVLERIAKWGWRRPAAASLLLMSIVSAVVIIIGSAVYNARLQSELERSDRLFGNSQDFSRWILFDHLDSIGKLRGSVESREQLVEQVLTHLDKMSKETSDDSKLAAEVAMAYERVAEVQGDPDAYNLGRATDALASYRMALRLREQVAIQKPNDVQSQINLIYCQERIAKLQLSLGIELDKVRQAYKKVLKQIGQLRTKYPENERVFNMHIKSRQGFGDLQQEEGKFDEALHEHLAILDQLQQFARESEESDQTTLAIVFAHSRAGKLCELLNDTSGAMKHFESCVKLAEPLVKKNEDNTLFQRELSVALFSRGGVLLEMNDVDDAMADYERGITIRRAISDADPQNLKAKSDLGIALEWRGIARIETGDVEQAIGDFGESLAIAETLVEEDKSHAGNRRQLWTRHGHLGGAYLRFKMFDKAKHYLEQQLSITRSLTAERGDRFQEWIGIAEAEFELAKLLFAQGSPESFEGAINQNENAIRHCQASLDAFESASKITQLTDDQATTRDKVSQVIEVLKSALEKLRATE